MQLIASLQCASSEGEMVGRMTVLPILLSGVLPYAQPDGRALEVLLCNIMQNNSGGDEEGVNGIWAVDHLQVSSYIFLMVESIF